MTVGILMLWVALVGDAPSGEDQDEPSIELTWDVAACPSRSEVIAEVAALGISVAAEGKPPARVEGHPGEGSALVLVVSSRGREITRRVDPTGDCQERAAVVAAIIEFAVKPLFPGLIRPGIQTPSSSGRKTGQGAGGEPPETETETDTAERASPAPELSPGGDRPGEEIASEVSIEALLSGEETVEIKRGRKLLLDDWEAGWQIGAALVAAGGVGPTFRAGFDGEVRYELSPGIFTNLRLSYRTPIWNNVGETEVRMDDGFGALGLHVGSPEDALALQTTVVLQVVWARGYGFEPIDPHTGDEVDRSVVEANPGITMGGCYQIDFSTWGLEICVRGFAFLRYQFIKVNNNHALEMPFMGGETSIGMMYRL